MIEVDWYENYDLHKIKMPVNPGKLDELLKEANYETNKRQYLLDGFRNGFDLGYTGSCRGKHLAPNLKLTIGDKFEMWNKVMAEVKAGCYAGPYTRPPFKHFIQSPIGLVPKEGGKKTRLIFHLSYPRSGPGKSVNDGIPDKFCLVKDPHFEETIKLCLQARRACAISKSDMSMAFCHIPLSRRMWNLLLLKAYHPITGKLYYFVDKCLPFRALSSCTIFQAVSNCISAIVKHKTDRSNVNY